MALGHVANLRTSFTVSKWGLWKIISKVPVSINMLLLLLSRFSRVRLFATLWIVAYQALPSMGFSRQDITFLLGSVLLVFFPPRLWFTVNSNQLLLLFGFIFFSLPIEADPGRFSRYHSLILSFTNGVLWFMGSQSRT